MEKRFSIRTATERYRISARTLRYYEEVGLLSSYRKEGSRYREYDEEQLGRIEIILLLRSLSFSIQEIIDLFQGNDLHFRDVLEERIKKSELLLIEVRETTQLLRKLSLEIFAKPPNNVNAVDILNEFVYITGQTERRNAMIPINESLHRVAIGRDIILKIIGEDQGDLIKKIKIFRSECESKYTVPLPIIRVYDSDEVEPTQVSLIWNGYEVWQRDFKGKSGKECSEEIILQIKNFFNKL